MTRITNYGARIPTNFLRTMRLAPGVHCVQVNVDNTGAVVSGMNMTGSVTGQGLVSYACCSRTCGDVPVDTGCSVSRLDLSSNSRWNMLIDAGGEVTARCADSIAREPGWSATNGGDWIGAPIFQDSVAVAFRKCFCVDQPTTVTVDSRLATTADYTISVGRLDLGASVNLLHGQSIGPDSSRHDTMSVNLDTGCYCVTVLMHPRPGQRAALNASLALFGPGLLKESCCVCGACLMPAGLEHARPDAPVPAAMLAVIPNPASGATTIRYVLGETAPVTIELYNVAGERAASIDRGVESRGEHSLAFDARAYPAGAYRLVLRYGARTSSIAVQVR
jgi:hypothetical protein